MDRSRAKEPEDEDEDVGPPMKKPIDPARVIKILECRRKVLNFVESMLEPEITFHQLRAGEELICKSDYDSITQERQILKICGYPLCSNKLTKEWKQRYQISLSDKRIYDVEIRKLFCSVRCMDASIQYRDQYVPDQPVWMRSEDSRLDLDEISGRNIMRPQEACAGSIIFHRSLESQVKSPHSASHTKDEKRQQTG